MGNGDFIWTLLLAFWNCNQADCCPTNVFIVYCCLCCHAVSLPVIRDGCIRQVPHYRRTPQHREDRANIKVHLGDILHLHSHQFSLPKLSLECCLHIQYWKRNWKCLSSKYLTSSCEIIILSSSLKQAAGLKNHNEPIASSTVKLATEMVSNHTQTPHIQESEVTWCGWHSSLL